MAREPAAIAELRRSLGELLATFRQAADLTQARLAQITICDRTRVAHIEKGRARADERFWQAADQACHADGVLVAAFHELQAAKHEHERQARESELAEVRAKAAQLRIQGNGLVVPVADGALRPSLYTELEQSAATLERPWRVDSGTLNAIASVLASTRRLEDQTSATAVLPSVRNLVGLIDVYAGEARSQVRDQALTLASELHCYAGWLWLEAPSHPHAAMHFDTAMSLAVEADNADHLSHAASFKGYMALQTGKLGQAISLSTVSARDTRTLTALRAFTGTREPTSTPLPALGATPRTPYYLVTGCWNT